MVLLLFSLSFPFRWLRRSCTIDSGGRSSRFNGPMRVIWSSRNLMTTYIVHWCDICIIVLSLIELNTYATIQLISMAINTIIVFIYAFLWIQNEHENNERTYFIYHKYKFIIIGSRSRSYFGYASNRLSLKSGRVFLQKKYTNDCAAGVRHEQHMGLMKCIHNVIDRCSKCWCWSICALLADGGKKTSIVQMNGFMLNMSWLISDEWE